MFYRIANDHALQAAGTMHDPAQQRRPVAALLCHSGSRMILRCSLIEPDFIRPLPALFRIYWKTRHLHRSRR